MISLISPQSSLSKPEGPNRISVLAPPIRTTTKSKLGTIYSFWSFFPKPAYKSAGALGIKLPVNSTSEPGTR